MEQKKKRINYIILAVITVVVIFACVYSIRLYKIHKENDLNIAILSEYLNEIKINELSDYLVENPDVFIYVCFSDSQKCRDFELEFRDYIVQYNLREHILYLNLKTIKDEYKDTYEDKIKEYLQELNLENIPAILTYYNGKLSKVTPVIIPDDILKILDVHEVNYLND